MGKGARPVHFTLNVNDTIKDDKRNLTILEQQIKEIKQPNINCKNGYTIRHKRMYKIKCNICKHEWIIIEENLITRKDSCPCCSNKTVVHGINDVYTTNPELIKYFKNIEDSKKYVAGSNNNIEFKCPDCGYEKVMTLSNLLIHEFSCNQCSDGISYPNKFSYAFLNQLPVKNIIHEFSETWSKPYRYDIYFEFNNNNYILEMDGGFHTTDNKMNGRTAKESKEIDNYKDKLAKEHNINVIRIDCKKSDLEYIKENILHSELSSLFDLSAIDWLKCNEYATKNLVKEICYYWDENHFNMSNLEIAKHFSLNTTTIISYLKQGRKFGWCEYITPQEIKYDNIVYFSKMISDNPSLTSEDIAKQTKFSKYIIRDYLEEGCKLGLCNYNKESELIDGRNQSNINLKKEHKEVMIFDLNNNLLGTYKSIKQLETNSMKDFNIFFNYEGIRRCCNLECKKYKQHIFKYVV